MNTILAPEFPLYEPEVPAEARALERRLAQIAEGDWVEYLDEAEVRDFAQTVAFALSKRRDCDARDGMVLAYEEITDSVGKWIDYAQRRELEKRK